MSEEAPACTVSGCTAGQPHEHRWQHYDIERDCFWFQLRTSETHLLNELLVQRGQPRLVFRPLALTPEYRLRFVLEAERGGAVVPEDPS